MRLIVTLCLSILLTACVHNGQESDQAFWQNMQRVGEIMHHNQEMAMPHQPSMPPGPHMPHGPSMPPPMPAPPKGEDCHTVSTGQQCKTLPDGTRECHSSSHTECSN